MEPLRSYQLDEIEQSLKEGRFPFSGISQLGSTEFHFRAPSRYLGVALHSGNAVRAELSDVMAVSPHDRFREEDPYTERFIEDFPLQIIAHDSRFEYDLNCEQEQTIYSSDEKKWGLKVWNRELTEGEKRTTYSKFKEFHAILDIVVELMLEQDSPVVLFDIHSFCYQRERKINWFDDEMPEINLGIRYINRHFFSPLIDCFLEGVSGTVIDGHPVRVVENELFPGGYLTRKYAQRQNRRVLVLAIEYKKIFMDEWTGDLYNDIFNVLKNDFLHTKEQIVDLL